MVKQFKIDYFSNRIFPHIKAIMSAIPERQPKLTHEWVELREFIYRTLHGVQEPDVPARISIRTSGIQEEFKRGVTKKRLRKILDEILWMHLASIAWYPKEAPLIAEHCFSFFQQNKAELSDEQISQWDKELNAVSEVISKYKEAFAVEEREKAERLQKKIKRLSGAVAEEEKHRELVEIARPTKKDEIDEVTQETNQAVRRSKKPISEGSNVTNAILLVLLVAVIGTLGWYAYAILNVPEDIVAPVLLEENNSNISTPPMIPLKISFSEYLDNKDKYDGVPISLIGFLRNRIEGRGNSGVYAYSLVDDVGREIVLKQLSNSQKSLFIKLQTTPGLFNVSGTLKKQYDKLELDVTQITPAERPVQSS